MVVVVVDENFGLGTFCTLKCWKDFPDYKEFVRNKLTSFEVDGWGGFVLKDNEDDQEQFAWMTFNT